MVKKQKRVELVNRNGTIARPYEDVAQLWIDKGWSLVDNKTSAVAPSGEAVEKETE